ncbi:hypothetical protein HBA54_05840 [Pelagibius litoralis]|uniref:Uncharacterized protein n=1 Tax=Pelagibius litoralis TaxID=374515 RepID=A0A967C808_9PROT|nr:hypothetical protein [Pelagibius litoralis]NIA68107.1 hypothetical protein [Pelagibius litoralis]
MDSLLRPHSLRLEEVGIGHNAGPPLVQSGWHLYAWKRARKEAWKSPPIEVVRQRARRARELGMTYQQYTLEILERGRFL